MSNPNTDREERVEVPERIYIHPTSSEYHLNKWPLEEREYVEYVRGDLLDSQVLCLHCEKPIRRIGSAWLHVETKLVSCRRSRPDQHDGIYRAEPATAEAIATRMRDRCVEKVRDLAAEKGVRNFGRMTLTVHEIADALMSLTLDGEQEK